MKRTALATWQGRYKNGRGTVTILDAGLSDVPFSYSSRFEGETALSPEGLIAAAHATSFAMAFAQQMESKHLKTERIDIVATVKVEEIDSLQTISEVALEIIVHAPTTGNVPILDAANHAMNHCSVSRLINAKITLDARVMAPRYSSAG